MLSRIASIFRKSPPSVKLNVLLYEEDGEWIAHCLQMDIVTSSVNQSVVIEEILDLIQAQVEYAIDNNNMDNIFKSAPAEDWERLAHFQKCEVRKITINTPKADKTSLSIPIREVELCLA